jgi:hypothetical protein
MTVHAPTGTSSINVSLGCGHAHSAERELGPGEHFSVTCAACEPHILATKTGWSSDLSTVALTPDERAVYEQQEKVGQRAQAIAARALADRLGDVIRGADAPAAPVDPVQDVIAKLSALNNDQLAALRAVFTADQAAGAAEAKRGPGRPKKSAE